LTVVFWLTLPKETITSCSPGSRKRCVSNPFAYYILGCCNLLNVLPENYESIVDGLMNFLTPEGGFSAFVNSEAQMYETFRAVNAINFIDVLLERNGIKKEFKNKIKHQVVKWVKSCESNEGGFSWAPNERPYV